VPLFAVLIRAMEKLDSKCGHARFPWCFPMSIWERCGWAITVCSINPLSRATLTSSIRVVCVVLSPRWTCGTNGIKQQFGGGRRGPSPSSTGGTIDTPPSGVTVPSRLFSVVFGPGERHRRISGTADRDGAAIALRRRPIDIPNLSRASGASSSSGESASRPHPLS